MKQILITIVLAAVLTIPFAPTPEEPEAYAAEPKTEAIEKQEFEPWDIPLPDDLQQYIHNLCEKYDISYPIHKPIKHLQSRSNSKALSTTND